MIILSDGHRAIFGGGTDITDGNTATNKVQIFNDLSLLNPFNPYWKYANVDMVQGKQKALAIRYNP